ncbi:hypothetical protein ACOSQ3_019774 [Xanthoceras sorbifolium]
MQFQSTSEEKKKTIFAPPPVSQPIPTSQSVPVSQPLQCSQSLSQNLFCSFHATFVVDNFVEVVKAVFEY